MKEFLFCIGGKKPEVYARRRDGREWLVRGMVYEWAGETVPDPHDPEHPLLVVRRPWLGKPVHAPRSEFIPIEEVAEFFNGD
jgi:hypothetical protein